MLFYKNKAHKAQGLQAEGVHIRQTMSAHVTTVYHGPSYWQAHKK